MVNESIDFFDGELPAFGDLSKTCRPMPQKYQQIGFKFVSSSKPHRSLRIVDVTCSADGVTITWPSTPGGHLRDTVQCHPTMLL